MRISKSIIHPVLVIFVAVAFLCFTTGCSTTRSETVYDKDGKPSTVEKEDPWLMLGWYIIGLLVLGGIAAGIAASAASLEDDTDVVLCFANTGLSDSDFKFVEVRDEKGNRISSHILNVNSTTFLPSNTIDLSKIEIGRKIENDRLQDFLSKNFSSDRDFPDVVSADLTLSQGNVDLIKIEDIGPGYTDEEDRMFGVARRIRVTTEHGSYSITSCIRGIREDGSKEIDVTISKISSSDI